MRNDQPLVIAQAGQVTQIPGVRGRAAGERDDGQLGALRVGVVQLGSIGTEI
jgi:hypothetical protein